MTEVQRTLTNLIPNMRYAVRIRSVSQLGVKSKWSEALEFKTGDDGSVPATPTGLDTRPGLQAIVVTWDAATEIDFNHYELHAAQISGFEPGPENLVFDGRVNTYSHPTESGQRWYFRIRSVDVAGNASPYSDEEDDIPNYLGDQDILAQTISAGKLSASEIISNLTLSAKISTGSAGPRVEMDTDGIRGYALNGIDKSFWYNANDGSLQIQTNISAGSTITGAHIVGGDINIGSGTFTVDSAGQLSATGATISGAINATSGSLGSLSVTGTLTGGTLSGATVSGSSIQGGSINIGPNVFIVDSSGNVQARANIAIGSDYSGGIYPIDGGGVTPDYNWGLQFNHVVGSSQYRVYIAAWVDSTNRSVGFRNSFNDDHQVFIDYSGGTRSLTRTAFITVSDPSIKKDMRPLKQEATKLGAGKTFRERFKNIDGYTYFVGRDKKRRTGFDAEQVKAEFPDVVYEDVTHSWVDGKPVKGLGVAYEEMIPHIVELIKEQDEEIAELRAIIEQLRKPKEK